MEKKLTKLGGSLKVPIVQELAKEISTTVPPRYVCLDRDDLVLSDVSLLPEIPVIDILKLFDGNLMNSELDRLHNACQEWGFFQVINHGVDSIVVEKMKIEIEKFFNLSIEERSYSVKSPGMWRVMDKPLLYQKSKNLIGVPFFGDAIEAYSAELKKLAMKILYQMAEALQMKGDDIKVLFEEGFQAMRMNYYPPCPQPELVNGLCPHTDSVGLTILLQVNEMEGLPISPLPNAFVINIGDILEIVTNGAYRSIEHRATVNSDKERLSIATFLNPKLEGDLGPARSLITPDQTPAKFKRIGVADYFKEA